MRLGEGPDGVVPRPWTAGSDEQDFLDAEGSIAGCLLLARIGLELVEKDRESLFTAEHWDDHRGTDSRDIWNSALAGAPTARDIVLPGRALAATSLGEGESVREATAVIGMGHVGLPLAEAMSQAGYPVVGFDTDPHRARDLAGIVSFTVSADRAELSECASFVICVPTPLDAGARPDTSALESACATVAEFLAPGAVIIVESTLGPGMMEGIVRPMLEKSGLVAGADFALAYAPERIDPGNDTFTIRNTPRVIGGLTPQCAARAAVLYEPIVDEVVVTGLGEAELSKLIENAFRQVNLAFVNELVPLAASTGIDLREALRCAATKPFGFMAFDPGPGVGGHCIPVDPMYLAAWAHDAGTPLSMVERAQAVNDAMPTYVVERTISLLADERPRSALLVGVAFKPGVSDVRNSPATGVVRALRKLGVTTAYLDPLVEDLVVDGEAVPRVEGITGARDFAPGVITVLQHQDGVDFPAIAGLGIPVLDCRGRLAGAGVVAL